MSRRRRQRRRGELALTGHAWAAASPIGRCHLAEGSDSRSASTHRADESTRRSALPQCDRRRPSSAGGAGRAGQPQCRHRRRRDHPDPRADAERLAAAGRTRSTSGASCATPSGRCRCSWNGCCWSSAAWTTSTSFARRRRGPGRAPGAKQAQRRGRRQAVRQHAGRLADTLVISRELTRGTGDPARTGVAGIVTEHGARPATRDPGQEPRHSHRDACPRAIAVAGGRNPGARRPPRRRYADPTRPSATTTRSAAHHAPLQEFAGGDPRPARVSLDGSGSACRPTRNGRRSCNWPATKAPAASDSTARSSLPAGRAADEEPSWPSLPPHRAARRFR